MTHEVTQAAGEGPVILPREVFDFLMGMATLEGTEFGELNDGLPGRFWWRAILRAAERETAAHRIAHEALLLARIAELEEVLAVYSEDQLCDLCERLASSGNLARATLKERKP